jgi:hypothetical protein
VAASEPRPSKAPSGSLPGWVNPASRVIIALQGVGISFFSFHVLRIPGRRSGVMRPTVVSPFVVEGQRYVLSFGHLEWVRNAQAAGWGLLSRGRHTAKVALVEVGSPESRSIVGAFPRQVPAGVQFFTMLGLVEPPGRPDQFEAAADRLTLFRIGD